MTTTDDHDAAYDAFVAEMEKECHASLTMGGSDPYGTSCDLDKGHTEKYHEGPDPFDPDARIRWTGGGYCAGDPLPYHILERD